MPYLVTCPKCSSKLKSGQPVPAGRSLVCPQCKTAFTLSEPAPEVDGGTAVTELPKPKMAEAPKAPVPSAPPLPPAKPSRSTPNDVFPRKGLKAEEEEIAEAEIVDAADFDVKTKPKRSRDDDDRPRSKRRDDDDDRSRSRSRAEEDERPKSRRKAEDEDDRPSSRRRDDEEDDRPSKSKRRNDDDLEFDDKDRPKSRKSRHEEDDSESEDDAPRSRSRKKKGKKGNRTLLIALLGGGAGLLLIVFLVGFFWLDPFGLLGGSGVPSEMLAWAPADTEAIAVIDVVEARKLNDFKDSFSGNADAARHGLRADEVASMMVASSGGIGGQEVVVYKLISSVDQQRVISALNGKEATANGKKYYRTSTNGGLHFPSSRMIVVTQSENTMQILLQKGESSIIVSEEMRSAAKRASGVFVLVTSGKAAAAIDRISSKASEGGIRSATARSFVYSLTVSDDRGTGIMVSTYDSSETARRISDDLRKNMERDPTMRGEIDSFDIANSGSTVTFTLRGPVKGKKTFMPFGGR